MPPVSTDIQNGGDGEETAAHPLQPENLCNCNCGKESPRHIAFHAANFAFIGLLLVYIQVMYPDTPTAFETHSASMITSLISLCLYACGIMLRMIVKTKDFTCSLTIFNYTLVFSGILTPVSLVSVFLPYKPIWLVFFICALFSTILAHYFFKKIKAVVDTMFTRLCNLVHGTIEMFNSPSYSTSTSTSTGSSGA